MNESPPKVVSLFILVLCLLGRTQISRGQEDRPRETQRSDKTWEKVYSGSDGSSFRTVYSMPWHDEKNSHYRWLWVGEEAGSLRFMLLDPNSSLELGANKTSSALTLNKLEVDPSGEKSPGVNPAVNSIWFLNEMKGYLLKGNKLYRTDNAGFQWRQVYQAPNGPNRAVASLHSIAMTPSKRACMVGMYSLGEIVTDSLLLCTEKSLDSDTVQWKRIDLKFAIQLWHISFTDDKHGWIVGTQGTLLKTDDGGKSWEQVSGQTKSLVQSYFLDERRGWIVGRSGTILRTVDSGDHWDPVTLNPLLADQVSDVHFRSIKFAPDNQNGWIVGDRGTILATEDGGETWNLRLGPLPREGDPDPNTFFSIFVDDRFCWAVGKSGPVSKPGSVKSTVWRYRWK